DFSNQYQNLFYASVAINILTLLLVVTYWSSITDVNTPLTCINNRSLLLSKNVLGMTATILLIPLLIWGFNFANFCNAIVVGMSILMFFVILSLAFRQKLRTDKLKIMAYLILTVTSIIFWMIYYTGPMGIAIFIKNNVDKHLFGYEVATQWLLNINALVIITGAPFLSSFISRLQAKGFNFSTSMQFVWAFIILALSFGLLACGIIFSNGHGYTSIYWVVAYFAAQACAELFIGPVGYAMIGKIAPAHLQGILMGTWMLVSGVAASISHYFSNAMVKTTATDPLLTNADYLQVFQQLGAWALGGALFLYLLSKKIGSFIDSADETEGDDRKEIAAAS
ncbi:MAG: transporter, partial [Legionellales bacterium RIFCSPHIGHO2_12_FULL_42_9]